MKYAEKLRDPRWQKKRLEILQRDDWTCQVCWANEYTLVVHHRYYAQGKEPWDYPDTALVTWCEFCHAREHELRPTAEQALLFALRAVNVDPDTLNSLSAALIGLPILDESDSHYLSKEIIAAIEKYTVKPGAQCLTA